MTNLCMVDAPCTGNTVKVRSEIHLRVLESKSLADAALTETITVTQSQLHIISTGLVVSPVHGIQR